MTADEVGYPYIITKKGRSLSITIPIKVVRDLKLKPGLETRVFQNIKERKIIYQIVRKRKK